MIKIKGTVYAAVTSLIFLLLNDLGILNIGAEKWDTYVVIVATILAGLGIMVDPVKTMNEEVKTLEDEAKSLDDEVK